jgi:hypothetical protein
MRISRVFLLVLVGLLSGCVTMRSGAPGSVWVCHGGRNPKWQRVSAAAADAHRRHGDQVSEIPKPQGQRCR